MTPLYILLATLDLLITAHKIRRGNVLRPVSQPAPRRPPIEHWGLAVYLFAALGQFLGYTIILVAGQPLHPLVDLCFLSSYPAVICLFLLLPGHVLSKTTRLRLIMDSIMVMLVVGMFSWYFLLGPMLFQSGAGTVDKIMLSLYPGSDLALLLCLVLIAPRVSKSSLQPVIGLFSLAVIILVFSDSIVEYQVVHNIMVAGTLLDVEWTIAFMFSTLAVQFMQTVSFAAQNSRRARVSAMSEEIIQQKYTVRLSMGYALLPYLLVPAFSGLTIFVLQTEKNPIIALGIYASTVLLFLLILLRQIVAMREFAGLAKTTQHLNNELQTVNQQLKSLATTDPLTELPNHRALIELLNQELGLAESYQRSCSLLFLDLDHFKAINDGYGHAGGDTALRRVWLPAANNAQRRQHRRPMGWRGVSRSSARAGRGAGCTDRRRVAHRSRQLHLHYRRRNTYDLLDRSSFVSCSCISAGGITPGRRLRHVWGQAPWPQSSPPDR